MKKILCLSSLGFVSLLSFLASSSAGSFTSGLIGQETLALQKSIQQGKEVYIDFCIQCHLANGKGTNGTIPPLDGSDWLVQKRRESIHAVKYGQSGPIVVNGKMYHNVMPPMGLSDEEVADVMNYIMNSWSNTQKKSVTVEEVAAVKK